MATPIIIDTDPGIDDAMAILLALRAPELDVRALTIVHGNSTLEQCTLNARSGALHGATGRKHEKFMGFWPDGPRVGGEEGQHVRTRTTDEVPGRAVSNAGGLGSLPAGYLEPAKVRDLSEFLVQLGPVAKRNRSEVRSADHEECRLAHAQRIRSDPRGLLAAIPGLELSDVPDSDQCCGSAGVYNLLEPDSAREIGERKVDNILSVAPQLLASANPGCTLQIRSLLAKRGVDLPAAHPIEILDVALS